MYLKTQQSKTKSLVWSGYAVFIWSIAYMLPHLYWALGGKMGGVLLKPGSIHLNYFEWINWVASVFLTAAGLIGLAFIYWSKSRVSSYILLFISFAGCSLSTSHGIYGIFYRILQIIGVADLESGSFDINKDAYLLWDLLLIEPWFLIEGILLGIVGWYFLKEARSRKIWLAACIFGTILGLITGIMGVRFL
ncbi:DUF3995 domain-containing protein [Paenibacillus nasutitermitis]|uniref:DUF3995 domain-containing protein n=1 Tax=Paenibacillus nasutitermitis TaxID=1652958 RepID=A0A917E249_9BACL|nr:DUF3995 domain-containing protein [Paenibacillus nasutitermitis]GGD97332.1 hypothetical protein GCM10010911_65060 [Paenibacillus nasutitermitis]